ncbi:hypothetical protein ACFSQE_14550 [Vogesella fluminis]|uniref:hypothetical protein n=1 Tax=Vogesella fluminis TaxID=1069161 RepID=UPI00363B7CB7
MSSKDQRMANAFDPATAASLPAREQALIQRRLQLLGQAYRLFYEQPLHVVRGEGCGCTTRTATPIWTCTTTWPRSGTATRGWWRPSRARRRR